MTLSSRRDWIRTACGASAFVGTGGRFAFAEKATCGVGIGTYGLQSMALTDALRFISKTGFDAAEITVFSGMTGDPKALDKAARREVAKVIDGEGLRLSALMAHLTPSADDSKSVEILGDLKRTMELAQDLKGAGEVPLIQTVLGGKEWEASKELLRDRVADWAQLAADQKVPLGIKPHRSSAMSTPAHAAWLLKQMGETNWIKMVYDFSHYAFRKPQMTVEETVKESIPMTSYIAVKDAYEKDGKVLFGLAGETGSWDLSAMIKQFHEGGYRGDFCCEVSSLIWKKDPKYDPVKATEICYQNLTKAFKKAGVQRD